MKYPNSSVVEGVQRRFLLLYFTLKIHITEFNLVFRNEVIFKIHFCNVCVKDWLFLLPSRGNA